MFSVESLLTCKVFVLKYWTQVLLCCVLIVKLPFYSWALQTGWVLSQFRRAGRRLPDLRDPYLCNRLMDFLDSKFCGIAQACSCALSWSFAHLTHMGLPMGQKLVKFGTNRVQTFRNVYLWKWVMDLAHLKFYGIVSTYSCALSYLFAPYGLAHGPKTSGSTWARPCGTHISETVGWIYII